MQRSVSKNQKRKEVADNSPYIQILKGSYTDGRVSLQNLKTLAV